MSDILWKIGIIFAVLAVILFSTMTILNLMMRKKEKKIDEKAKGDENELIKPEEE